MKKIIALTLSALISVSMLTACGKPATSATSSATTKKVVTTIFPIYDWTREIIGDGKNVDLTMLLKNGVDLHSYQPTTDDLVQLSDADLVIYVGGESDEWIHDALKNSTNPHQKSLNLLEILGDFAKKEELLPGMQESDHDHDHDDHDDHDDDHEHDDKDHPDDDKHEEPHDDHDHEDEYDEHIWLSVRNAEVLTAAIASALEEMDPEHKAMYEANSLVYADKLSALDKQYENALSGASRKTLLFGDRFPFRYLADDYGLGCFAAFEGCSAETEASFETVSFLAKKVDELKLPYVLTIDGSNHKIAETIVSSTKDKNQTVATLDSMQSTDSHDVANNATYLSIMEKNLEVLKQVLN